MAKPNRRTLFHRLFSPRRSRAASAGRTMIGVLESRTYLTTTFSGPTNFPGITSPTAIAVADFTSGTPGVAVEGYAPSSPTSPVVGVYLQSSGSFGTPTINPFGSLTGGTASGVAAGDFLNNGDQDIAALGIFALSFCSSSVTWRGHRYRVDGKGRLSQVPNE